MNAKPDPTSIIGMIARMAVVYYTSSEHRKIYLAGNRVFCAIEPVLGRLGWDALGFDFQTELSAAMFHSLVRQVIDTIPEENRREGNFLAMCIIVETVLREIESKNGASHAKQQ